MSEKQSREYLLKLKTRQFPVLSPSPHLLNEELADSIPDHSKIGENKRKHHSGRRSEDPEIKTMVLPPILSPPVQEESIERAKET